MAKIKLTDVKMALLDPKFQKMLPEEAQPQLAKFLSNPGCSCNHPIYRMILSKYPDLFRSYFPHLEYETPEEEDRKILQNNWRVINCRASELESQLRNLPPGRKQIAISRFEDSVTVIINELDAVFAG